MNNFIKNNTIKSFKSDKLQIFFITENKNNIFVNLSIAIDKFENLLSNCLKNFKKEKIHQNKYKLYSFDNKHLKLFNDDFEKPFLEILLIIFRISENCLIKRLTSCIDVPLPLAILLRRLPFNIFGLCLSTLVIELIIASTLTNASSLTCAFFS